jgi:hypothetical protein
LNANYSIRKSTLHKNSVISRAGEMTERFL